MACVKVSYDRQGNTLTVWFEDPRGEHICEETGEEIVLAGIIHKFRNQRASGCV